MIVCPATIFILCLRRMVNMVISWTIFYLFFNNSRFIHRFYAFVIYNDLVWTHSSHMVVKLEATFVRANSRLNQNQTELCVLWVCVCVFVVLVTKLNNCKDALGFIFYSYFFFLSLIIFMIKLNVYCVVKPKFYVMYVLLS